MSITTEAYLVVGLNYKELYHYVPLDVIKYLVNQGGISRFSPYYDAEDEQCIFGFSVQPWNSTEDFVKQVTKAKMEFDAVFFKEYGITPRIIVTNDVG